MSTQPFVSATAVGELYASLMSSRRIVREGLKASQDIERRHPDSRLADLVGLAGNGGPVRAAPRP